LQRQYKNLLLPLIGVVIMLVGILMNIYPELGQYPIVFSRRPSMRSCCSTHLQVQVDNYSRLGLNIIYSTILAIIASVSYYMSSGSSNTSTAVRTWRHAAARHHPRHRDGVHIHPTRNLLTYVVDTVIIPKRHPYQ
jgi:hypothetical protein